ncbi:MAG: methionyl-tRNA formyltransferase [Erysipelotrichaceae bacterium]|nr:methionyl-tRNA formyltransferase [Erysipelotrichaceae bacterium]
MKKVKTLFMGTPEFACSILEQLYLEETIEVVGLISQPDRKVGRKQVIVPTPTKVIALEHNTPVYQPEKLKADYEMVKEIQPDLIITCAYGQMVPDEVLSLPKLGCFNVHASLLPKLRGGAPIHKAIMYGEKETGITIMEMVHKMDAGDMISQKRIPIESYMTMGDLYHTLMKVGSELLHETLPSLLDGTYTRTPQDESQVTYAWNVSKEEEKIDFTKSYREVYDHMRSLIPSPVSYGICMNKKIKFWAVHESNLSTTKPNGTIVDFVEENHQVSLAIAVDGKLLMIDELQLEGKPKISARDFKNGQGKHYLNRVIE